jgi:hypothetical protein
MVFQLPNQVDVARKSWILVKFIVFPWGPDIHENILFSEEDTPRKITS